MSELSLEEQFAQLSRQKLQAGNLRSQQLQAEKEKAMKQNALVRLNALRHGEMLDDDLTPTPEEILLAETADITQLTVDESGHLRLISSIQDIPEDLREDMSEDDSADELIQSDAGNALRRSRVVLEEKEKPQSEMAVSDAVLEELPEEMKVDKSIPIAEDAKILRLETTEINEARIFIAVEKNPLSHESGYAYYVERGRGESKSNIVVAQSSRESRFEMIFYAISGALQQIMQPGNYPVQKATIYMERLVGNKICQNSGNSIADPHSNAVAVYRSALSECRDVYGIKICIAPAEARCAAQELVKRVAKSLVEAPI